MIYDRMEASQHSLFDDLGDTDFLDTPISNSYESTSIPSQPSSNGISEFSDNIANVQNSTFSTNTIQDQIYTENSHNQNQLLSTANNGALGTLHSSIPTCSSLTSNSFMDPTPTSLHSNDPSIPHNHNVSMADLHLATSSMISTTTTMTNVTPQSTQNTIQDQFHAPVLTHPSCSTQQFQTNTQYQSIPTSEFQGDTTRLSPELCPTSTAVNTSVGPVVQQNPSIPTHSSPLTPSVRVESHVTPSLSTCSSAKSPSTTNSCIPASASLVGVNCFTNPAHNPATTSSSISGITSQPANSPLVSIRSSHASTIVSSPMHGMPSPHANSPHPANLLDTPISSSKVSPPLASSQDPTPTTAIGSPSVSNHANSDPNNAASESLPETLGISVNAANNQYVVPQQQETQQSQEPQQSQQQPLQQQPLQQQPLQQQQQQQIPQQIQPQQPVIPANKLIENLLKNQHKGSPQLVKIQNNTRSTNSPNQQMIVNSPKNNNQQLWQHNGNVIQQLPDQAQYVIQTDSNNQQWAQISNQMPLQQVILQTGTPGTSQGQPILIQAPAASSSSTSSVQQQHQQVIFQQTATSSTASLAQHQQVILQQSPNNQQQVIIQQNNSGQPLLLQQLSSSPQQQQNVLLRPSTSYRNTPLQYPFASQQKVMNNSPIVQIKINNQLLNISMDQLKQLQNIPTKVNKPTKTKTPRKSKSKNVSVNIETVNEEKKMLLSMTFRNTIQQARLEHLMKITNDKGSPNRTVDPSSKAILHKSIVSQFLPGWQKLPQDVHQQVFNQLEEMPKEQRDLFFMNQPKILKRFEAQFQKLQKNQIAKNPTPSTPSTPAVIQQIIVPARSSPVPLKIKPAVTKVTKVKPPTKKAIASLSAGISINIKNQLMRDQELALYPDCHTPFESHSDTITRLKAFHVFQTASDFPEQVIESEKNYRTMCSQLIQQKKSLLNKFQNLLLKDAMRQCPTPEHVMMLRRFVKEEQAQFTKDKEVVSINPESFIPMPFVKKEVQSIRSPTDHDEPYTMSTKGQGLKLVFGKNSPLKRNNIDFIDSPNEGDRPPSSIDSVDIDNIDDADSDATFIDEPTSSSVPPTQPPSKRLKINCDNNDKHRSSSVEPTSTPSQLTQLTPLGQCSETSDLAQPAVAVPQGNSIMVAPSAAITVIDSEADLAVAGLLNCVEPEQELEPLEDLGDDLDTGHMTLTPHHLHHSSLGYEPWSGAMNEQAIDDRFDAALAIPNADNTTSCRQEIPSSLPLGGSGCSSQPDDLELAIQSILG